MFALVPFGWWHNLWYQFPPAVLSRSNAPGQLTPQPPSRTPFFGEGICCEAHQTDRGPFITAASIMSLGVTKAIR
jgi:hypothetical protein